MNEQLSPLPERKLYYDGVNHTADAVIIDPVKDAILLIQRHDTGAWALPGGFVDNADESDYHAALREAKEEIDIDLTTADGILVFRGIVDDPRNTEDAWIETSAYLFFIDGEQHLPSAGDDAASFEWKPLSDLPTLYASHGAIVARASDFYNSKAKLHINSDQAYEKIEIDGGHMGYDKIATISPESSYFTKAHNPAYFTDDERASHSRNYLKKEAAVMAHLRSQGFESLPQASLLIGDELHMEYFPSSDQWHWRAPEHVTAKYINDSLAAFKRLEELPLPVDSFDVEASLSSFLREGWQLLDEELLVEIARRFMPRLSPSSQRVSNSLLRNLADLHHFSHKRHTNIDTAELVYCHHDARQANIAWHPDHGTRLVDWSWASLGESGSDATMFLIDLHKSGIDISEYRACINKNHCFTLAGFWLNHATMPAKDDDDTVRFQQFVSALSAYELLLD